MHNIWEVGYPPIMQLLHMKHHDHAIKQYGQEGLNSSVPLTHTFIKIINY